MKKLTLKVRLILFFFLIAVCVWFSSGFLSWRTTREQMDEFFDTYQLLLAKQLSSARWADLRYDAQIRTNRIINTLADGGEDDDEALGFAVFDETGEMIFNDGRNGQHFTFNPNPSGFMERKIRGDKWRIVWMRSFEGKYIIAVGQELEFRDEAALDMILHTLIPWGAGLFILIFASVVMVSNELRPIHKIAHAISERAPNDLSPVSHEGIPREIRPPLTAMNKLFSRIEKMIERERSFIADSAHELRSPLAALKIQLDVALMSDNDKDVRDRALRNLEYGIERLVRLVEQLLALSRLESNPSISYETLDWTTLVKEVIQELRPDALNKSITLKFIQGDGVFLRKGQGILWSLLIRNLVDNAIKYSPQHSEIRILLNAQEFSVSNTGVTVNPAYLQRLCERFYRPKGQHVRGSGLGLSIVKKVAELHNCFIDLRNTRQGFAAIIMKNK